MKFLHLVSFVFIFTVALPVSAQSRVELLATTTLTNRQDVDFIRVTSCKEDHESVHALKLKVSRDNADIDRVVVKFGNGETQELDVRTFFRAGSESRWLDLSGFKRCVRSLKVVGDSGARRRRSVVQIYGMISKL